MSSAVRQIELQPSASRQPMDPASRSREEWEVDVVRWSDAARAWLVTGYAEVLRGFRDSRLSPLPRARQPWEVDEGRERMQLRRRAAAGFTPQALDHWQRAIRPLVRGLVEEKRGAGRMDAVEALARRLPPLVMAELLDIPEGQRARFLGWARLIADSQSPGAGQDEALLAQRAHDAARQLLALLASLVEARRLAPGGDLLSQMMSGPHEASLAPGSWVPHAVLFLLAEHASTADLLGNALHVLLAHPEQLRRLRDEPTLLRAAVEEVLRFCPAVPGVRRVVTETFLWRGRVLRKGDEVLFDLGAANRDPSVLAAPERFDITRDVYEQRHLSFGFGPHHCLSAGLVRRELEALLEVLPAQLPGLRLDEEQPPRPKTSHLLFRGWETLTVRW